MSKKPREQIDKAAWTLMEGIKDAVSQNVAMASTQGQFELKGDQLQRLLMILNASVEEGYHRGGRVFSRAVETALKDASLPPLGEPTPQKKSG